MAIAAVVLTSCNPETFLDRNTLTALDDNTYWSSENNVRLFVNGAYGSYFCGYSAGWTQNYAPGVYSSGEYSDERTTTGTQANILISVPADNWYRGEASTGYWLARRGSGPWNFAYIRKWNLLLERLDTMKENGILTDEAYNHWTGVTRFLRGWEYSRFVESFGDVPYYDHQVSTSDWDDQYKDRDPRTLVMDAVKADFDYAMKNVRVNDGVDYINRDVVATIASRCMLFEGTWYIYHKTDPAMATCSDIDGHAKTYLQAAYDYANVVVSSGKYSFNTDLHTLFGNLYTSLTGTAKEVILYRAYNKSINNSSQHCIASYAGGNGGNEGQSSAGNFSTLKAWICQDGKPYSSSEVANAKEWDLKNLATSRDARFESTFFDEPHSGATGLYVHKFIDRTGLEYGWNGQACPACYASCTNENGYPCVRYSETVLNWIEAKAELAAHFGGAAVTQDDIDKSINAIRTRPLDAVAIAKGVKQTAPLQLSWINDSFDPERTSAAQKGCHSYAVTGKYVDPVVWEIRRERRMEFFMEQYRVVDIRRWGQLELMDGDNNPDMMIGAFIDLNTTNQAGAKKPFNYLMASDFDIVSVMPIEGYNADGTVKLGERVFYTGTADGDGNIQSSNADQMVGFMVPRNIRNRDNSNFNVRNYLEPICTDVISQYTEKGYKITQNPGWEN